MSLLALLGAQTPSTPPLTRVAPEVIGTLGAGPNFADPPAGAAIPLQNRPLGWYYDDEDVVISWTDGAGLASWVLRDYEGTVVAQGTNPVSPLNLGRPGLGWYKLYFTRAASQPLPWVDSGGETHFIVSRSASPLRTTPFAAEEGITQLAGGQHAPTRELVGHGLIRLDVYTNETDPASWRTMLDNAKTASLKALASLEAIEESGAAREVFIQFTYGTGGPTPSPVVAQQITDTVQELCAIGVTHFEGMNEPNNFGVSGAETAATYAAFAATVHAAHPEAKVVGPAPVTINPTGPWGLSWFEDFLVAGGGAHVDVISFHPYNATNGDLCQGRRVYGRFLNLLSSYGVENKPRWQTEWGTFAIPYGVLDPRWQAQTTMLDMHLQWQMLGVHRNQALYFYDVNNGYWNYPSSMWSANRGRRVPYALPLVWRTWVEETWEMDLIEALDFGPVENRHWIGSRFRHPSGLNECLTIQGSGAKGSITLSVAGASSVQVANHFGRVTTVAVTGGRAVIQCGPEPVHVRVPAGVGVTVVPTNYGSVVLPSGVTFDPSTSGNGPERAMDGELQNSYEYGRTAGAGGVNDAWMATPGDYLPAWWTARFAACTFDTIEVICPPPWQGNGSLLDFDIQVLKGGQWETVYTQTITPPSVVWTSDKATSACWSDIFWDRRRIFVARLGSPTTATGIRIWARNVSWGGSATVDQARTLRALDEQGRGKVIGQGGHPRMTIQDVALYLTAPAT